MLTVTESKIILGMTIDDLLHFDKHVYAADKKGYNFSKMILSNNEGANIETYIYLYCNTRFMRTN